MREDITNQDKDRSKIRKELLELLEGMEKEGWLIIGLNHMHLEKTRWLARPQELSSSESYLTLKSWLRGLPNLKPRKAGPGGAVKYVEHDELDPTLLKEIQAFAESIYFSIFLVKDEMICIVSFGEHKFNHAAFEQTLGRAQYNITFKDWKEMICAFLNKK